jgi:hypothetical protein
MVSGVPIVGGAHKTGVGLIGGLWNSLRAQNNFRASAPGTAPGTDAIRQQLELAARRAQAAQHSAIASARGPSAALMAREGMRRGAMAQQAGLEQAGILQKQLEQGALDQQMRAQEINARIAGENAKAQAAFMGSVVSGVGGILSDKRAKQEAFQAGAQAQAERQSVGGLLGNLYGSQTAGHADGRRVLWTQPTAAVRSPAQIAQQSEMDRVQRDANAAGVVLTPDDWQSMGYQISDKRAKDLADENEALRQAVLQLSGVPTTPSMRKALPGARPVARPMEPDVLQVVSDGKKARVISSHSSPMSLAEVRRAEARMPGQPPAPPRQVQIAAPNPAVLPPRPVNPLAQLAAAVRSDEDAKREKGDVDLEFPAGVEPKAFTYKPEFSDGDPGVHYGVMAQDLEKSKEGASVVSEDPATGMKQVDPDRLTMLNTAALSDLERRLRKLEARG